MGKRSKQQQRSGTQFAQQSPGRAGAERGVVEQSGPSQFSNQLRPKMTPSEIMAELLRQMGFGLNIMAVGPKGDMLPPQMLLPAGWSISIEAFQTSTPGGAEEQIDEEPDDANSGDDLSDLPGGV